MKTLKAIWKDNDLRKKCLLVLLILVVCRLLCSVPTPGVSSDYFSELIESNAALGFLDMATGGGMSSLSIMALGVTPYITASIIIQLLGVIFPRLHELQTSPDKDSKRKMKWITCGSGIGLAFVEALAMSIGFGRQGMLQSYTWYYVLLVTVIWTLGAAFLIAMGELITDKLVGNGISLILTINILASFPNDMRNVFDVLVSGQRIAYAVLAVVGIVAFLVLLFAFIVLLNETTRNIPITYAGKLKGASAISENRKSELPIKLCPGSVIPIIFASSLLSFPILIASFMGQSDVAWMRVLNSSYWFNASYPVYTLGVLIYIALIFGFTYFYIDIAMSPYEIADNLKKSGGAVPGIRPGKPTSDYLSHQIHMVSLIGAAGMAIIAVIPYIIGGFTGLSNLSILGTSLIIVVSVILETKELLESKVKGSLYMDQMKKGGLFYHG